MKKMCLIVSVVFALLLCSCGSKHCKYPDCSDEATNGNYCEYHATIRQIDQSAKNIFDYFSDN